MVSKAADIMTRSLVTVTPDETNVQAAQKLVQHGISAMPVCDVAGHIIGVLSEGDLMRPFRQSVLQKRARWLGLLAEGEGLSNEFLDYVKNSHPRVRDLMTFKVISASEETTISELAELMVTHHIKRIPILRGKTLAGIVSRADIIRALAQNATIEA